MVPVVGGSSPLSHPILSPKKQSILCFCEILIDERKTGHKLINNRLANPCNGIPKPVSNQYPHMKKEKSSDVAYKVFLFSYFIIANSSSFVFWVLSIKSYGFLKGGILGLIPCVILGNIVGFFWPVFLIALTFSAFNGGEPFLNILISLVTDFM